MSEYEDPECEHKDDEKYGCLVCKKCGRRQAGCSEEEE